MAATATRSRTKQTQRRGGKPAAPAAGWDYRRAAELLKMVADPTRLQVLDMLREQEWHVGAMCARIGGSQPAVSHHLALLRHGGIIATRRQGKNNFYALTALGRVLAEIGPRLAPAGT